ncbi:putative patatin/cPLA2 family phospholipase [Nitrobacteraceae bacterium AZCC 2146]
MARSTLLAICTTLFLAGCASLPRAPLASTDRAYVPDIPRARISAEDGYRAFARSKADTTPLTILALSGGGADGSYGAGFLKGWSASGLRPDFDIVTGSSVGSLIAPFAFLGPDYDRDLEAIFTSGVAEDLLHVAGINAVVGSGIFKSGPMKDLIAKYANNRLVDAVAARHRKGKLLIIATTNLDAQRTTLWNMGEIAVSNSPSRFELFRAVLAASAAIPGIFPPGFINVQADGNSYVEMHVDGGVTSNILAVPENILTTHATSLSARSRVFVIVNGKLSPDPAFTSDLTLPIVARSFQTSVKANTRNAMIATYDFCRRNNWQFNATAIDAGKITRSGPINFDTNYMKELYAYGYAKGASGRGFQSNLDGLKGPGS